VAANGTSNAVFQARTLFADENKNAGRQRDKIDQEEGRPERQAESEQAMEDQINREQKHADAFREFHDVNS
jgi:hypothetical protein